MRRANTYGWEHFFDLRSPIFVHSSMIYHIQMGSQIMTNMTTKELNSRGPGGSIWLPRMKQTGATGSMHRSFKKTPTVRLSSGQHWSVQGNCHVELSLPTCICLTHSELGRNAEYGDILVWYRYSQLHYLEWPNYTVLSSSARATPCYYHHTINEDKNDKKWTVILNNMLDWKFEVGMKDVNFSLVVMSVGKAYFTKAIPMDVQAIPEWSYICILLNIGQ